MTGIAEHLDVWYHRTGLKRSRTQRLLCTGAFLVQVKWNWEEEHEKACFIKIEGIIQYKRKLRKCKWKTSIGSCFFGECLRIFRIKIWICSWFGNRIKQNDLYSADQQTVLQKNTDTLNWFSWQKGRRFIRPFSVYLPMSFVNLVKVF